jgi:hypothetical protein
MEPLGLDFDLWSLGLRLELLRNGIVAAHSS